MRDYEVGSHFSKGCFDCFECAEDYYNGLTGMKYLAECNTSGAFKIIQNTYGMEKWMMKK